MEIDDALAVLHLDRASTFEDMRRAYRELLLRHHPDVDAGPEAADRTTDVIAAFRMLRSATADGTQPLPPPPAGGDELPVLLVARPGDVFQRLHDATEAVAEISYIDRTSGMLQAIVTQAPFGTSQLTAEVDTTQGDARILFTLESLTDQPGPPIADIVRRISPYL